MAYDIALTLNPTRSELLRQGYGQTRLASSFRFATLQSGTYKEAEIPPGFWREPITGTLMLQPSSVALDLVENSYLAAARYGLTDFVTAATLLEVDKTTGTNPAGQKLIALQRADATTAFTGLSVGASIAAAVLAINGSTDINWLAQTANPLKVNEGWSVYIEPYGTLDDRASNFCCFCFGNKFFLKIDMNGTAALYYNYSGTSWTILETFAYASGGVDHTKPFQLSVIPWGPYYISFLFSQASIGQKPQKASGKTDRSPYFLVNLLEKGIVQSAVKDPATNQYPKVDAANWYVGARTKGYGFLFAFSTVLYQAASFALMPEILEEPKATITPTVTGFGYEGQRATPTSGLGSYTTISFKNEADATWTSATDTQLVTKCTATPSADGRYTPEIWSFDTDIAVKTQNSPTSGGSTSISTKWMSFRFKKTSAMESSPAHLRWDATYSTMLQLYGGISLSIDGTTRWDGYVYERRAVPQGVIASIGGNQAYTLFQVDDIECEDMWSRLENTPVGYMKSISGATLYDTITALLQRSGISTITFDATDTPIFQKFTIDGFNEPGDSKIFSEDCSIADALRSLSRFYGVSGRHNFRVLWDPVNQGWAIYIPQAYDSSLVTRYFCLDPRCYTNLTNTDTQRWALNEFAVFSQPEFHTVAPDYNQLQLLAPTTSGDGAQLYGSFIAPATGVLGTSTNINFQQQLKPRIMPMPYTAFASSANESERIARNVYEEDQRMIRVMSFEAEWQPGIEVDQYVAVLGRKTDDSANVSYGAWRIDEIAIEIATDDDTPITMMPDRRFTWKGNYTLVYAGSFTNAIAPAMFSATVP